MDWIGKMSPYCTLGVGGVTRKTRVVKDGGMKPRWGQSFAFSVAEGNQFLTLRCWDKARLGLDIFFMFLPPAPRTYTRARSPATGGGEARGGFSAAGPGNRGGRGAGPAQETLGSDENVGSNKINLDKVFAFGVQDEWYDVFSTSSGSSNGARSATSAMRAAGLAPATRCARGRPPRHSLRTISCDAPWPHTRRAWCRRGALAD